MAIDKDMQVQVARSTGMVSVEQQRALGEVQAAYVMARANPRDSVTAIENIMQDCMRPGLAEVAVYQYGRGGATVSGPSIRLAEAIAKRWGNCECGVKELSRHDGYSECMAYAVDLETNFRDVKTFQVKHWRDTKQGGYKLTDERDLYELVANMGARRKRACILAIIPGDVVDAAVTQCEETLTAKADTSPEAMQKMLEAFEPWAITREHVEKRIQRKLDAITAAQVVSLKKVYASLRDGVGKPGDFFDFEQAGPADGAPATAAVDRASALAASVKAARAAANPAAAAAETHAKAAQDHAGAAQAKPEVSKPVPAKKTAPAADPAVPAGVDPATGEVSGGAVDASPAPTFAQVMARVETATGEEDLDLCLDLTNAIANLDHRTEVRLRIGERRKEFAAK